MEREGDALIGRRLGEFVIRERLSGGGFGMVFLAEQAALRREAVIKVLHERHASHQSTVQRFLREARLASLLDHPYAAHTYAFGAEADGVLWIAMELVRGTTLETLLRVQGPMPLERFVPLLTRICEVVQTAHEQGIVHRDLKPANVMVLSRAGQILPKLLDFGIAKLSSSPDEPAGGTPGLPPDDLRLTADGMTMGSPHYMAPEQWTDAAATDERTDIYALGVIAYQALVGHPPFRAPSRDKLAALHARAAVPPLGPAFPPGLDVVLATAMAKKPQQRHQSALDLAAAFRAGSGITDPVDLPKLDAEVRDVTLSTAPQPLAQAVVALEAARNAHQARDAVWQLARVAARLVAAVALASHAHIGGNASTSDSALGDALLRLRERTPSDAAWLEVARELVRRFAALRDAHPVPELVAYLVDTARSPLDDLVALRAAADEAATQEAQVIDLLERALRLASDTLRSLAFLSCYALVARAPEPGGQRERDAPLAAGAAVDLDATVRERPEGEAAGPAPAAASPADVEVWMGARGGARPLRRSAGRPLEPGHPALLDAAGTPIISLWPFMQLQEPTPGAGASLFFFDGRGRRGARMVALPDTFELEDDEPWTSLGDMLRSSQEAPGRATVDEVCPYQGLAPFTEAQADAFCGRERETEAFVNRLRVQPLLLVTGPSGAGKSSFVQAGVLPALPDGWSALVVRPGATPIASLTARLGAAGLDAAALPVALAGDPDALGELLRARAGTSVLVVDQLEELFTLCDDPEEQARYAGAIARAARPTDDRVRVVMTLRDDFLVRAESLPAWRSRLGQGLQILTVPAAPELRRILLEPLRRAGYELDDPELADEMVDAVAGSPAALALLSFTAARLWDLRDRRFKQLSRRAYRSLGGVSGALARHAEDTLTAMPFEEQRLVREVFRHAVTGEGTRAVLSPDELEQLLMRGEAHGLIPRDPASESRGDRSGRAHAAAVVEKLVAARLLVLSDTELGERIEVAHETLLEAWPRLVTWRREDLEGARLRDLLRSAARQWDERGRSGGLLWRGDALTEYRLWRGRTPGALTDTEEAFAAASLAEAARGRRLWRTLLAGAFVVLAGVAVALLILNARADRQRALAVSAKADAEKTGQDLHDLLLGQYERQGRTLVLGDDPLQGLAFLARAAELGAGGLAHDFVVAQAVRATDGELFVVQHEAPVGRARFSPDGDRLVTTGYDDRARLWDAKSGALVAEMPHESPVLRVAFSPDGQVVATGSLDGAVKLWDARSARLLHALQIPGAAQTLAFSIDGSRLVTNASTDDVRLWDTRSGALVATLREATDMSAFAAGAPCALSPDGTMIAAGDQSGLVRVWDARSAREIAQLRGHGERITTVQFSPDSRRLVTASQDDTAAVWHVASRRRERVLQHRGDVSSAAFSPDGARIATASADETALVWDAETGAELLALAGHAAGVNLAVFSPDGRQIVTVSDDATAQLWDAHSGTRLARHLGHGAAVRDVAFSADGQRIVTASVDRTAIVWSTRPTQPVLQLAGHQGAINTAAMAPDSRHVVTGGADGTARIWDTATGREVLRLRADGQVVAVAYDPDGGRVAIAGYDRMVKLWDARTGALRGTLAGHTEVVSSLAWSPDGQKLVSGSYDGTVRVWSALTGEELVDLRAHGGQPIASVAVAPSGSLFATTGGDGTTGLWDTATGSALARFEGRDARHSVAFDPTGTRAVSATDDRSAVIWRVADGEILNELSGHVGDVFDARWAFDGRLVVTASADGTARVWDAETGEELGVFRHGGQVLSASISANRAYLVMAGSTPTGTLADLPRYQASPADFERLLRCRVPWVMQGNRVAKRARDLAACRRDAQ